MTNINNTNNIHKTEWRTNFEKDLRVLDSKLAKPSVTAEGNIFELVYNYYCKDVMFSGEALDKAKPAFDFIMETYTASCTAISNSKRERKRNRDSYRKRSGEGQSKLS